MFRKILTFAAAAFAPAAAFLAGSAFSETASDAKPIPPEVYSGGDTTVFDITPHAFSLSARNLGIPERRDFVAGNSFFNLNWVTAPASTATRDGLGPYFNAASCSACHLKDGRGRPPEPGQALESMLVRLSAIDAASGKPVDEPTYGGQLQNHSLIGVEPEGELEVRYEEVAGAFADGEAYSLRKPVYSFRNLKYGEMATGAMMSPRVAPAMIGMGLLAAIDAAEIAALADPVDANKDGVSGRPNYVTNDKSGRRELGRFGWKANQPTIEQQVAGAFNGDMGITSSYYPAIALSQAQSTAGALPTGGSPEIDDARFKQVVFYSHTLAVPARRDWDAPKVMRGEAVFCEAGCQSCHRQEFTTGDLEGFPQLSKQSIRPFTDLLLHDMGEGLADNRPDGEATGVEWRTAPLWGMGLLNTVNNHTLLLHDGRARDAKEAILWHAGEAENSRQAFVKMSKDDREALLAFLGSL